MSRNRREAPRLELILEPPPPPPPKLKCKEEHKPEVDCYVDFYV